MSDRRRGPRERRLANEPVDPCAGKFMPYRDGYPVMSDVDNGGRRRDVETREWFTQNVPYVWDKYRDWYGQGAAKDAWYEGMRCALRRDRQP